MFKNKSGMYITNNNLSFVKKNRLHLEYLGKNNEDDRNIDEDNCSGITLTAILATQDKS